MGFNSVAPYYDALSKIVFGSKLEQTKYALFEKISDGDKILFIGGGTGGSLIKLLNLKTGLNIDFVDSSKTMIALASRKVGECSNISFYAMPIEKFKGVNYDFVITEFFFDMFNQSQIEALISLISLKLKNNGKWIDTDFRRPNTIKNRILLKLMYQFFMIVSNVKAKRLVCTVSLFEKVALKLSQEKKAKSGFISSQLYSLL